MVKWRIAEARRSLVEIDESMRTLDQSLLIHYLATPYFNKVRPAFYYRDRLHIEEGRCVSGVPGSVTTT
jgi:hypothetical protein